MVGSNGLEPSTSRLSGVCSNQLSYEPVEPRVMRFWWRLAGSNRWPPACRAGALPAELNPQKYALLVQISLRYDLSRFLQQGRNFLNGRNKSDLENFGFHL